MTVPISCFLTSRTRSVLVLIKFPNLIICFVFECNILLSFFKNKCTQYWPEKDKGMDVGPCKIKLLEETEYAFHTYRKFTVQQNNVSFIECFKERYYKLLTFWQLQKLKTNSIFYTVNIVYWCGHTVCMHPFNITGFFLWNYHFKLFTRFYVSRCIMVSLILNW